MTFTSPCPAWRGSLSITSFNPDPPGATSITLNAEHTVHESGHVNPLGDANQPAVNGAVGNELLALQVQAFLEASEDVDVDAETIEDILEVLVDTDDQNDSDIPLDSQTDDGEDSHDDEDGHSQDADSPTFSAGESKNGSEGSCFLIT